MMVVRVYLDLYTMLVVAEVPVLLVEEEQVVVAGGGGAGQGFAFLPGTLPALAPMPSAYRTATGPTGLHGGGGGAGAYKVDLLDLVVLVVVALAVADLQIQDLGNWCCWCSIYWWWWWWWISNTKW